MKNASGTAIALAFTLGILSCSKSSNQSPVPEIAFSSLWPDSVHAGSSEDTAFLQFHYSDGDADLGNDQQSANYDIFVIDNRHSDTTKYFFPSGLSDVEDPRKGVEGTVTVKLQAAFLLIDSAHAAQGGDTTTFSVFVKDRAQHQSNTITTSHLYLKP